MMSNYNFISYSSVDALEFAFELYDSLLSGPPSIPVWLDKREIKTGQDWDEQIVEAIRTCESLIFLMTSDSVEPKSVCKLEWTRALSYKKAIVPILLQPEVEMPFRLGSRQWIDFTGDFNIGLAKLRKHLRWLSSPEGGLKSLKDRLEDATLDHRRAGGPDQQIRIEKEMILLKNQIDDQQRIIDDPAGAAKRVEESIIRGIQRECHPEKPVDDITRTKFINPPPAIAPTYFQDRHVETNLIGDFLKNDAQRLMTIVGRGGIGKTAMVCRLLKSLEGGRLPDNGEEMSIDGIIYLSETGTRKITVPNLYADLCSLLPDDIAKRLDEVYRDPKTSTESKMQALMEAFPSGQVLLLLDNFENLIDSRTHNLTNIEMNEALKAIINLPPHGVKVIITTRVAPRDMALIHPQQQFRLDLEKGLESPYAENILREMDADATVGLKDAPDELLNEARERTLGNPRALEALFAILSADRDTELQEILSDSELLPENVVEVLVGEAFSRLDPTARKVMEALAIYSRPVSPSAVDYLLQPHVPGVDSARVLNRLVNMKFVRKEAGRYYMHPVDKEYALSRVPEGDASDRDEPVFTQFALLHLGADYFKEARMPKENWKTIDDLSAQLAEFDLRCAGQDYDTAADVLLDIGFDYLFLWGHYRVMTEMHERLHGKLNDPKLKSSSAGNLGITYCFLEDYRKAIEYYKQALVISREIRDRDGEGTCLGNLGSAYSNLGQVEKAIEYYEQALAIAHEIGYRLLESVSLINMGDIFVYQNEWTKAIKLYNQARMIADEIGYIQIQNGSRSGLARAHLHSGDLEAARSIAESAFKYDYPMNNHNVFALLGVIALRQGDSASAKDAFETAVEVSDSLLGHNKQNFDALDAIGLALCGLALCDEDTNYIPDAISSYEAARSITRAPGVVGRVLQLFDELAKADTQGLLSGVREAVGGK
ncbi:MAG: tetratricopeptide repeat protein [Deltaproteobacteria bacterium]|jgi:tetratricopeptide (TPR) repeat protein|nr:tetratricopeptide repeat protein [Deltaproteobacteria bacterium]